MKKSILDFTKEELALHVKPAFRAKQIYSWVYHKYASTFEAMKNLPKTMRESLDKEFSIMPLKTLKKEQASDGTIKYLFELDDGKTMETVLLRMKEAYTDD
ncbi:MAG: 23S rRNA (adenine(2503)-C(2))-methyltransferase RlmN, partial [Campylobacterota bacterium]|nr:23S rRNA (adenine(2503)-C(2))-methyltransferase RlmN [Campylobacterota bacterium]